MTVHLDPYRAFLEAKIRMAPAIGLEIADQDLHQLLKPHQREIARLGAERRLLPRRRQGAGGAQRKMGTATLFDLGAAEGWLPEKGEAG